MMEQLVGRTVSAAAKTIVSTLKQLLSSSSTSLEGNHQLGKKKCVFFLFLLRGSARMRAAEANVFGESGR